MAVLLLFLSEQIVVPRLVEVPNLKCALSGLDFNEIVSGPAASGQRNPSAAP